MASVSHDLLPSAKAEHPDQEHIHLPGPSWWPILLAGAVGLLPMGLLLSWWAGKGGTITLILGGLFTVICLMGWANSLIRETAELPNVMENDRWLRSGLKLFLISEAAIFGAFFAHHYYSRWHAESWPPAGAPILDTSLPAIATLLLMSSSATMEWAHSSLVRAKRSAAFWWLTLTIILGVVFLGFQGHEWGFLKEYDQFTHASGIYGTLFYIMTGFHGLHVATGIVMLIIVWVRMRLGHFDPQKHFAFVAASWYWHFVDLIWILLFFTIYLF